MSEVGLVENLELQQKTLKQQLDAIDQEIINDIADKSYDFYFKTQIGLWSKGKAIGHSMGGVVCPINWTKLEQETGRDHRSLQKWYELYAKNQDEEKFQEKAKQIAESQTLKRLAGIEALTIKEANEEIIPLPEGEFDIILADCPWRYDFSLDNADKVEQHYPTMDLEDIKKLKLPVNNHAVLFLWATAPKLLEALEVMKAWEFTYKTNMIWDKEWIGMGFWFRGQHELLLVGVKGDFSPPESDNRVSSVYREKRTEHSKKPEYFYELIENMFPQGKYLELFARKKREKWTSYGNEIK